MSHHQGNEAPCFGSWKAFKQLLSFMTTQMGRPTRRQLCSPSPFALSNPTQVQTRQGLRRNKRLKAEQVGEHLSRLLLQFDRLIRVAVRSARQVFTVHFEQTQV
jgi:hypothetical protein